MEDLFNRIINGQFKKSTYTVYNKIEEDGFIDELEYMFGKRYGVEDFEIFWFDLSKKEKNAIKYRMLSTLGKFYRLKTILECDIQEDKSKPKVKVYITKDKPSVLIVKLKQFDVNGKLTEYLKKQ